MSTDRLTTKEGVVLQCGQLWRDLDKRMKGRVRKIIELSWATGRARMKHPTLETLPPTWVSVKRMHRHSTGWELVTQASDAGEQK